MVSMAFALWLGAQSPPVTQTSHTSAAERQVEALERHWLAVEDDPAALEPILADDFVHVLPMGFISKREQLDFMRAHPVPASERPTERHFEDLRVRVYGTAGIATGTVVATMPDGKVRKTNFTDVFAYREGKWRAVNAQETPLSASAR